MGEEPAVNFGLLLFFFLIARSAGDPIITEQSESVYTCSDDLYNVEPFALLCSSLERETCVTRPIHMLSSTSFRLNSFHYYSWQVGFLRMEGHSKELPFFRQKKLEATRTAQLGEGEEEKSHHKSVW